MNVKLDNQADQTAVIAVTIAQDDYMGEVEKSLKQYRAKANVPGFRPGKVPMGIINKMYRKGAIIDSAYKMASNAAFQHLQDEKIETLGDVLPYNEAQLPDLETQTEFTFEFQVGLAPVIALELTDKDSVERIKVTPTEEMLKGYTDNYLSRFGKLEDVEAVTKDEAVNVNLDNTDMKIEDAYVGLISMNDEERAPFIGKKVGDKMQMNINELYKDPKQRAAILSVKEEELEGLNPEFELEITQIRAYKAPEVTKEFLAEAFPEGDIKTPKAFTAKMTEDIQKELDAQTVVGFYNTLRDMLIEKVNPSLPEEFLKRWLLQINEGKFTMEQIEAEFPQFALMMKWDLIKRHIAQSNNIEINNEDMEAEAKEMARQQFAMYGMANASDEMLENFSKQILSDKDQARRIYDSLGDKKIFEIVTPQVSVTEKTMTVDEYSDMMKAGQN